MKNLTYVLLVLLLSSCKVNQLTGQKTLNVFSNKQLFPMAFNQYERFLKEHKVVENTVNSQQIEEIGTRIAAAAQKYFTYKGAPNYLQD
jgi:hypothetical protein